MERKNRMKHLQLVATVALLAVPFVGGCDEEEPFFRHCPLSETLIEVCQENEPDTALTCVVREHPMCDERVCAAWEGSDSFCSRVCTADAECPPASTCKVYLDYSVCVPDALPPGPLTAP